MDAYVSEGQFMGKLDNHIYHCYLQNLAYPLRRWKSWDRPTFPTLKTSMA